MARIPKLTFFKFEIELIFEFLFDKKKVIFEGLNDFMCSTYFLFYFSWIKKYFFCSQIEIFFLEAVCWKSNDSA